MRRCTNMSRCCRSRTSSACGCLCTPHCSLMATACHQLFVACLELHSSSDCLLRCAVVQYGHTARGVCSRTWPHEARRRQCCSVCACTDALLCPCWRCSALLSSPLVGPCMWSCSTITHCTDGHTQQPLLLPLACCALYLLPLSMRVALMALV
jgi:hypothetical protein